MSENDRIRSWDKRGLLHAVRLPAGIRQSRPESVVSSRERVFSALAPLREDDDVVAVTRARPID